MSRAGRILSIALITAGMVVLADAGLTLVWQEPVSAAYGALQQSRAADELEELEDEFPSTDDIAALRGVAGGAARTRLLAELFEDRISEGDAIGRITIDRIGLETVLVEGTDTGTLQRGPGHYPTTDLPGMGDTVGIAGHRTTYLAPFRNIDDIREGDEIRVEMPYATLVYRVERHEIVAPTAVEIVDPVGYERLVLTACHPLYSAAERYAVFARRVRVDTFAISGENRWPTP